MKSLSSSVGQAHASFVVVIFFALFFVSTSLRVMPHPLNLQRKATALRNRVDVRTYHENGKKGEEGRGMEMELYPTGTGSSLPDCSHACGPCFPCKRVMVSFNKCSSSTSESCPVVYRCICKGKYYHIPGL